MSERPIRIIVEVSGGVVRSIHSDSDSISIDVLDYDNMGCAKDDPGAREEYEYYLKLEEEAKTLGVKEAL
ncbi:hypothetical protein [Syntrophorhabdus aromaticivorans]|uniref:Uncharacterized protein n=1 Tax=Syntrophorhabdus aromaticivorans TaxID=328301 RepID=A0A971M390_9BACT|nr:hypothetical protein [Syntrophorhabdus aromaticivorans]NLW34552.1 hypothetical protein [Syntrophorhabdus aromaticivorans]